MSLEFKVSGVTQGNRQALLAALDVGDVVFLIPDPDNENDSSAIQVRHLALDGDLLGYVSRDVSQILSPFLGGRYLEAFIKDRRGGTELKPSYGLVISTTFADVRGVYILPDGGQFEFDQPTHGERG